MNENHDEIGSILQELRSLRRAVAVLAVAAVVCAAGIVLPLWRPDLAVAVLVLLGVVLATGIAAAWFGAAAGKTVNNLEDS
jgi:hypothetical protein